MSRRSAYLRDLLGVSCSVEDLLEVFALFVHLLFGLLVLVVAGLDLFSQS